MKKNWLTLCLIFPLLLGCTKVQETKQKVKTELKQETTIDKKDYGLFTGMDKASILKLKNHYNKLILSNINQYSVSNIKTLKSKHASNLYFTYNIDISNKDYPRLKNSKLVDLSNPKYMDALIKKFKSYQKLGITGFYLYGLDQYDDVYLENYKLANKIYKQLVRLLKALYQMKYQVYLCDGEDFVIAYLTDVNRQREELESKITKKAETQESVDINSDIPTCIQGVFGKEVFTIYDEETKKTVKQKTDISRQYKDYFEFVKKYNIEVEIVEFTKNSDWQAVVRTYSKNRDYQYHFLNNKALDTE